MAQEWDRLADQQDQATDLKKNRRPVILIC